MRAERTLPIEHTGTRVTTRLDDAQRDRVDDGVDVDRSGREPDPVHQRPAGFGHGVVHRADSVAVDGRVEQVGGARNVGGDQISLQKNGQSVEI